MLSHLPLMHIEDDKLGAEKIVKQIVNVINHHPSHIPFAISLNGTWGSGKSTVLNFLENSLDQDKYTVIRFNSWDSTDKSMLIRNLLEEIQYVLNGLGNTIINEFKKYSSKLLPPIVKPLSFFLSVNQGASPELANAISEGSGELLNKVIGEQIDKPLSVLKRDLAKSLKDYFIGTDEKIIVMIDEVDRLFPEEIIMVLQMIKSGLDLPGIVFILAADREVLLNALNTINISRAEEYLDKIFQKNIYLNSEIKFNLMYDEILLKTVNELENGTKLKQLLDIYFLHQTEDYVNELPPKYKTNLYSAVIETYDCEPIKDLNKVRESYFAITKIFREEYKLNHPRKFINFTNELVAIWDDYFNEFYKNKTLQRFEEHAYFILLLSHIMKGEFLILDFQRSYVNEPPNDLIVKEINKHLNYILPELFIQESEGRKSIPNTLPLINQVSKFLYGI